MEIVTEDKVLHYENRDVMPWTIKMFNADGFSLWKFYDMLPKDFKKVYSRVRSNHLVCVELGDEQMKMCEDEESYMPDNDWLMSENDANHFFDITYDTEDGK